MKKNRGHAWHKRKRAAIALKVRNTIENAPRPRPTWRVLRAGFSVVYAHPSVLDEIRAIVGAVDGLD